MSPQLFVVMENPFPSARASEEELIPVADGQAQVGPKRVKCRVIPLFGHGMSVAYPFEGFWCTSVVTDIA